MSARGPAPCSETGLQVVVLGAHRSGTSALTGALTELGLFVGEPEALTAASWENPMGFFERRDARGICDALLHGSDADWWKVSGFRPGRADPGAVEAQKGELRRLVATLDGDGRGWALKEPRLCLLFPFLREHLSRPFVVLCCRHPVEAARSLRQRNGFPIRAGLALWEAYTVSALRHGLGVAHEVILYEDLVRDPERVLERLAQRLASLGAGPLDPGRAAATIEPALRRQRREAAGPGDALSPAQAALWDRLRTGASAGSAPDLSEEALAELREFEVDEAERQRLRAVEARFVKDRKKQAEREALVERLRGTAAEAEVALDGIRLRAERAERATMEAKAASTKVEERAKRLQARLDESKALIERLDKKSDALREDLDRAQRARKRTEKEGSEREAALNRLQQQMGALGAAHEAERRALLRALDARRAVAAPPSSAGRLRAGLAAITLGRRARALTGSGLFDAEWYAARTPEAGLPDRAVLHYLRQGDAQGRDTHPLFDRAFYLREIGGDAALGALTALEHHLRSGQEGRAAPHPLFDPPFYLAENPDVGTSGLTALQHFVRFGGVEGRSPHPDFDARWYLRRYPEVAATRSNPLLDYLLSKGRRDPNPAFAARAYLQDHPRVAAAGYDPLVHYVTRGRAKGFLPRAAAARRRVRPPEPPAPVAPGTAFAEELERILARGAPKELRLALAHSETELAATGRRLTARAERPLVSVVMPTYNRAAVLRTAISSVLQQSYADWELHVCDDGSTDGTEGVVTSFGDGRIRYHRLPRGGAAAARNAGLAAACGEIVAYLDSDNLWHPRFLERMVLAMLENGGRLCAFAGFVDYAVDAEGRRRVRSFGAPEFEHERLLEKNFIDLNTFVHRRELYEAFGGFDERLTRRQDYALILAYSWLRDPVRVPEILALYQRNPSLGQITRLARDDESCVPIIEERIRRLRSEGPLRPGSSPVRRVTILSWDLCRNHFSKPFALAEALSRDHDVQLIAFDFFGEGVFEPLRGVEPPFETVYLPGGNMPDFAATMRRAAEAVRGDVIYCVKPRLPSLGVALLANARKGTPVILEINDLETVVTSPRRGDRHEALTLDDVNPTDAAFASPYGEAWTQLMDPLAQTMPVLTTHNKVIDAHFAGRCLYMRNVKDEAIYDPERHDRGAARAELGLRPDDRVLLFGGMLRRHKGIHELVELVDRLGDERYKALFVGSRVTPDQRALVEAAGSRITVLPPQDREAMARINLAADLVVLWLDPEVLASHHQMPYKATDALAMGPAILANDISDLGELGRQGYLDLVPFRDWEAMTAAIHAVFADPERAAARRAAARRLFERQFSYAAARAGFDLAARRALAADAGPLPAALAFERTLRGFEALASEPPASPASDERDAPVVTMSLAELEAGGEPIRGETVVIVTARAAEAGSEAAGRLVARAGRPLRAVVVHGCGEEDFVAACNGVAGLLEARHVAYATEAAFPAAEWLDRALTSLGERGMVALNDGCDDPEAARFGVVRRDWAAGVHDGALFDPRYRTVAAASELAAVARAQGAFAYDPEATLVDLAAPDLDGPAHDAPPLVRRRAPGPAGEEPIALLDAQDLSELSWSEPAGTAVVMPCIDPERGLHSAERLLARAGVDVRIFVVQDTPRRGFIPTLNATAARLDVRYVVYLAEDAFPGRNWLARARERLEDTGKGLLGFNCGKWHGRIAAFGMVRRAWVRGHYGDAILYPGYRSHRADNELTVLARAAGSFVYEPRAVLLEEDPRKISRSSETEAANFDPADRELFLARFRTGFDGAVDPARLEPLARAYLNSAKVESVMEAVAQDT